MKKLYVIIFLLLPVIVYTSSGGLPGEYLSTLAGSARTFGLGSAFTGMADDVSASYFNPAGLSQVNSKQVSTLFAPIFPGLDVNLFSVSYHHPLFKYGRAAINWIGLFSGEYIGYDWRGYSTGATYSEKINSFLLSYASPMYKNVLAGGANLKFLIHSIEGLGRSSFGFGIDLAGFYKPFPYLSAGLMLQNLIPPEISLSSTDEYFPFNLRFGTAFNFVKFIKQPLTLTADIMLMELFNWKKVNNSKIQFKYFTGLEYNPLKFLSVRAGFNFKEISAGFGLSYWGFNFDYSYGYNYKSLLSEHQYIRVSLLADIDKIMIIKKIMPVTPIPTTGHIVMGERNKNIAQDETLDKQINYDLINFHTQNISDIPKNPLGLIVDDYYKFVCENFKLLKFIIPVNESGFNVMFDTKISEYLKSERDLVISFYLPGTYINLKDTGPLDIEKSSKFIKDAIVHFKGELKLPLNKFEIIFPEKSFIQEGIDLYMALLKNINDFINENKGVWIETKVWGDSKLIIPGYFMLIDNYKTYKREILEKIKNENIKQINDFSFRFEYENVADKNSIIELGNLNNSLNQYSVDIKNVFRDENVNFAAELIYDLKFNNIKKQFFYSLWLANGIKSLILNGFKNIYIALKPANITMKEIGEREKMLIEIDKMYPDLKLTDPKRFQEIINKLDEKLGIKQEITKEDFEVLNETEKRPAYYIFEIFNNYIFDELILDKKDYIVTKTKDNNKVSIIFINNSEEKKEIDLNLLNLSKGVHNVKKIVYSSSLFYEKIEPPKVIENYEVNVISDLKINDNLLPTSITIILLELQSK